ncbi:MAG: hypothetical protein AMS18_12760 [Gemmatimonas sp. SG8_17]|nr:MAG: hypothetical protein AMS18_12760 [Gemmatimonas sp. SG8_17]
MAIHLGWQAMTTLARYTGKEHCAGHVVDAVAAHPGVHLPLFVVGASMAGSAVELECLGERGNTVEDRGVTLCALYVLSGDVHAVY